ncbi:hypothetical protein [Chroococcidiopsis sp. SAG 2025]|nr:hypothetical protein [Chroococcidiopsis sp. SAG 2025]
MVLGLFSCASRQEAIAPQEASPPAPSTVPVGETYSKSSALALLG